METDKPKKVTIASILATSGLVQSASEARRLIHQGVVSVDGSPVTDTNASVVLDEEHTISLSTKKGVVTHKVTP